MTQHVEGTTAPKKKTASSRSTSKSPAPADVRELIKKWQVRVGAYAVAHRHHAEQLRRMHFFLGIPTVALGAAVGTTVFGALEKAAKEELLKWILIALSVGAAVLAAIQTFLNFGERSGRHFAAATDYDDISTRLDLLETSLADRTLEEWSRTMEALGQRLDAVAKRVDPPPQMMRAVSEGGPTLGDGTAGAHRPAQLVPRLARDGFQRELDEFMAPHGRAEPASGETE